MSAMQRNKGKSGEREAAALIRDLTGWDVRRRVRQHDGDSDLEGVPGWSVEIKRHKAAPRGQIARWWAQTVAQAGGLLPCLIFRADRDEWRAVWPVAVSLIEQRADHWHGYEWTVEGSVQAWAAVARELGASPLSVAPLSTTARQPTINPHMADEYSAKQCTTERFQCSESPIPPAHPPSPAGNHHERNHPSR